MSYTVDTTGEVGYELQIQYRKRHLKPITAEGMFPIETGKFRIIISGKGYDWKYKGRKGFYYPPSDVKSDYKAWDYCYAWADESREYLYLNAYWIDPPSRMIPSILSGKYDLRKDQKNR